MGVPVPLRARNPASPWETVAAPARARSSARRSLTGRRPSRIFRCAPRVGFGGPIQRQPCGTQMKTEQLKGIIEDAWEARDSINPQTGGQNPEDVATALAGLDDGRHGEVARGDGGWQVHQWTQQSVEGRRLGKGSGSRSRFELG